MELIDAVISRLRELMKRKGATLYSLNREGGIAKSTLSQLLNRKQEKVSLNLLYDILSTMGVTMKEFFDDPIFDDISD